MEVRWQPDTGVLTGLPRLSQVCGDRRYGPSVPPHVVRLGAWCDIDTEDDTTPGISFRVEEFAVLADGRRFRLHADRGFSTWLHAVGGQAPVDPWQHLTREHLERSVRTTVLPDDAEDSGEEHPWERLSRLLLGQGIEASTGRLRALPYDVEFSDVLRRRVQ